MKKNAIENENKMPKAEGEVMALPSLPTAKKNERKRNRLFSSALFKESLHSNRGGLTVVSIGNAIIMVIIISILSTLHINATSSALKDLFDNADYETTVKSGAVSLYSTYENAATAYESFIEGDDSAKTLFETEVRQVEDATLNSSIDTAKKLYDATYSVTPGEATSKASVAKAATMEVVEKTLDVVPNYSAEEKAIAKSIISNYFDIYATDMSKETKEILKMAIPLSFEEAVVTTYSISDDKVIEGVSSLLEGAITRVYDHSENIDEVKTESSFALLPLLSKGSETEGFVSGICESLSSLYSEDKDLYIRDSSVRSKRLSALCEEYVSTVLSSFAYYQYLPSFTVEYKTNDLGWPVRLVGTGKYADNGNEIKEEVAVKVYNPDVFVKEDEKMGKTSNTVQKMRKEALTGIPYTEEEIESAKKEAEADVKMIQGRLGNFMDAYIVRKDGKNRFYDENGINLEGIASLAIEEVSEMSKKALIDAYNEKNDPDISSIEEITIENSSMSGKEMMSLVKGYASGGISSYNTYYSDFVEAGYSASESNLLALNKASLGVMASLPTSVNDSLVEMGEMNTYGIIVGVVAFGIAALLVPMVYTILLSKSLVSEKVETGSLAFTLSTPTTRDSFVFTQGCYLVFSEMVMALSLLLFSILTRELGIVAGSTDLGASLPVKDICLYALGNFMVTLAVSGINFLASCHFNKTSQSIGTGGGITIFFFVCSILGLFATQAIPGTIRITSMSIFNYMTIDSLFDALAVMNGDYGLYFFKLMFLLLIAIVTYVLGDLDFRKKDLPL